MSDISLVISDVDGTLVTPDKRLTDATVNAVRLLRERGIDFTLNSSRPPMGIRMLIEPLSLRLPIGTFNGGASGWGDRVRGVSAGARAQGPWISGCRSVGYF